MQKMQKINKKIEDSVVGGYKKIEGAVVGGYEKIENGVVAGYKKMEDKFIDLFLAAEGETTEQARERILKQTEQRNGGEEN